MMTPMRYVVLVLGVIISLHYILTFSHEGYGRATSISRFTESWGKSSSPDPPYKRPTPTEYYRNTTIPSPDRKANAVFVVLARNSDLKGILSSMKQMEDRFNKKFQYPWIFLNEEPFSEDFKKYTTEITNCPTEYGLIPKEHWLQPDWIDEERATNSRNKMQEDGVIYGGSLPYRNMCRFNSGFFFRHELLEKYDYYWRVEPDVKFFCDIDYDPFLIMMDENKIYGFTVSLYEYEATIPTLWETTKEFIKEHPEYISKNNAMGFLSPDGGNTYSRCHFWSNFEIGKLSFWRSEAYLKYFEHLDRAGGFYYERWGDAPVHSIAVSLFADKEQIHFFNDIGYRHDPFQHCPQGEAHARGKCWCEVGDNFDYDWYSCLRQYDALF